MANLARIGVSGNSNVSLDFRGLGSNEPEEEEVGDTVLSLESVLVVLLLLDLVLSFVLLLLGDEVVVGNSVDGDISTGNKTSVKDVLEDPRVIWCDGRRLGCKDKWRWNECVVFIMASLSDKLC